MGPARISPRRVAGVIALAIAAVAATAGSAVAACQEQPMEQSFLRFGDIAYYWQAPGGTFEQGLDGWSVAGGADVVPGNEPFSITPGTASLRLDAGASAVSPAMCIDLTHPAFRFVARPGGTGALVAVVQSRRDGGAWLDVLSLASTGLQGQPWAPVAPHPLVGGLPLGSDGTAEIRVKLAAVDAPWHVDSVLIDPYRRR